HQQMFDQLLRGFGSFLTDEQALNALRDKIRQELPTLANMFRADAYLLKKIVASAATLISDVEADPDHPLRTEFDHFVERFIEDLRTSPEYASRAEKLKQDLLARPELRGLAGDFWTSMRAFIEQDVVSEDSLVLRQLSNSWP